MSFHWLQMRITEEKERRQREAQILERLPRALEDVHRVLAGCVESYMKAFGPEAAEIHLQASKVRITVREQREGKWQPAAKIEVAIVPSVPGFQIDRGGEPFIVEVGMLPGDKLFYRDREQDQYLTMDELTRRILDRAFFPKLGE